MPDYELAHYNLGISCLIKGNRGKSLEEHKILGELDPYVVKKLLEMIYKD